jgi:signal transduction histidine kinase
MAIDERIKSDMATFRRNRRRVLNERGLMDKFVGLPQVPHLVADPSMLDGVETAPEVLIAGIDLSYVKASIRTAMVERWALYALATAMTGHEINSNLSTLRAIIQRAVDSDPENGSLQLAKELVQKFDDNMQFISRFNGSYQRQYKPISECMTSTLKDYRYLIQSGKVRIELTDAFKNSTAVFNQLLMETVLLNLTKNAVYWSSHNKSDTVVRFDVETRNWVDSEGETRTETVIRVEDSGPGIAEAQRERIFEPGVSGRNSTGIGLHLCRANLAESLLSIKVDDKPSDLGGAVFLIGRKEVLEPAITSKNEVDELAAAMEGLAGMLDDGHVAEMERYDYLYEIASGILLKLRLRGLQTDNERRLASAIDRINFFMQSYEPQVPSPGL